MRLLHEHLNRIWKQRAAFIAALVVAGLALGALAPLVSHAQEGAQATVRPDTLYMRHGPGTNYAIIAELTRGTTVTLRGQNGPWVFVGTPANGEGWLATAYLDLVPGTDLDALPFRDAPADLGTPMDQSGDDAAADAPADDGAADDAADEAADGAGDAEAAAPPVEGGVAGQTLAAVNMRTGPGTNYAIITGLTSGTPLTALARNDGINWVLVQVGSQRGWIFWEYVQLSTGYISNLPVSDVVVTDVTGGPDITDPELPDPPPADEAGDDTADDAAPPADPGAVPPPVSGGAGLSGFAYGGHVDSFAHPDKMRQAGMTWVKRQIRFTPGAPGSVTAGAINQAHGAGFKILLGIVGNPGDMSDPNYFEDYARFVGEVAALGPDAIEVWNEMNLDREWPTGQIDPAMYTRLLALAYNSIKGANPNVAVISGALAPTGAEGAFGRDKVMNDDSYLRGMVAAGATQYMDCIGAHYNEGIVPPNQTSGDPRSEYYTRYFWGMVNTYYNIFGGARPICFTELGYLSPEGYGPLPASFAWGGDTSVAEQAQWLAGAIRLARGSGRVQLVIVWNVDFTLYGADPMAGYAIVRPDGSCPACEALAGS